jgi:5-formyltetrahydrofolate cyclo-ligase
MAANAGRALAEHVCATSVWQAASTVALFATLVGEIETTPLIELARGDGKRILFPRMIPGTSLEFAEVRDVKCLKRGRYGVREPGPTCVAQVLTSDVVVFVPGLAFDHNGGRLGRGAGYYDRTFAAADSDRGRPLLVGIGFSAQVVESVPVTRFDVRMDQVVTEDGLCWSV